MTMTLRRPVSVWGAALGALFFSWAFLWAVSASALRAPGPLEQLDERDREALESLATYPEPLRESALRASQHSDVLVEMSRLQDRSSAAFHERISGLDEALQDQIWEVVRVPGLLDELGGGPPRTDGELSALAASHPELEAAIWSFGRLHRDVVVDLVDIHRSARARFEHLIEELPASDREAFAVLVEEPELVSMLTQRVRLAVHLGESFREDPEATRAHLDALGSQVASRNTAAEEDWEQSLADDPEAVAELEAAQRAYAEECDCEYPVVETEVIREVRVVHAYPYWFGYPVAYHYYDDFYPYGYWRPWHYYGGHYSHHGYGFHLSFALPPVHFLHWFFDGHHHRYPRLSHHFHRHHRHHPRAHSAGHHTVRRWARHDGDGRHRWRDRHRDRDHHRRGRGDSHHGFAGRGSERAFFGHRARQTREASWRPHSVRSRPRGDHGRDGDRSLRAGGEHRRDARGPDTRGDRDRIAPSRSGRERTRTGDRGRSGREARSEGSRGRDVVVHRGAPTRDRRAEAPTPSRDRRVEAPTPSRDRRAEAGPRRDERRASSSASSREPRERSRRTVSIQRRGSEDRSVGRSARRSADRPSSRSIRSSRDSGPRVRSNPSPNRGPRISDSRRGSSRERSVRSGGSSRGRSFGHSRGGGSRDRGFRGGGGGRGGGRRGR